MTPSIKQRIEQIRRGEVPEGYKQTGQNIVPITWKRLSFDQVAVVRSGLVSPKAEPYSSMLHIGPENIEKDTGKIENVRSASELGLISGKFYFDSSSIVYSKIRPNLNKVCVPDFEGICSADCYSIKARNDIDKNYLFVLMLSHQFYKRAVACSMRTGMPKINQDDLNAICLVLPEDFAEQQKIAAILTTQDKVIELKEKRLTEKLRQKKYLMQQLLTGRKRLPRYVGEWRTLPLKYLSEKQKKKNVGFQYSLVLSNSAQHGIVLQDQEFTKEIANAERIDGYYIVVPGAFVYNPRISISAPCGPINVNETGKTGIVSPLYIVFSISAPEIDQIFLRYYFQSSCWYKYVKGVANNGARHDRISISDEDFFEMPIPLPTKDEQTAIAQVLSTADREISLLRQDIEKEKQKKKALMQLLLTGIVRVNV